MVSRTRSFRLFDDLDIFTIEKLAIICVGSSRKVRNFQNKHTICVTVLLRMGYCSFRKKKKVAENFPFGKIRLRITRHLSKKKIRFEKLIFGKICYLKA